MIKRVDGVAVEIDQPQGRIILVQCPEHGRMSEGLAQKAWICGECGVTFTFAQGQKLVEDGYAEVRAADRAADKAEKDEQRRRMDERTQEIRDLRKAGY